MKIVTAAILLMLIGIEHGMSSQEALHTLPQVPGTIQGTVMEPGGGVTNARLRVSQVSNADGSVLQHYTPKSIDTDVHGRFSLTVQPGGYQVCIVGPRWFTAPCQNIEVKEGNVVIADFSLTTDPVWQKAHERADSEVMDQRLRVLAGTNAVDCGHVHVKESPANATKCAIRSFRAGKPFIVRYDLAGIESGIAGGLAGAGAGHVYGVSFDSIGMSTDLKDGETMPDGSHTIVAPCPEPAKIRVNKRGRATCFKKKSRNRLWILDEE